MKILCHLGIQKYRVSGLGHLDIKFLMSKGLGVSEDVFRSLQWIGHPVKF